MQLAILTRWRKNGTPIREVQCATVNAAPRAENDIFLDPQQPQPSRQENFGRNPVSISAILSAGSQLYSDAQEHEMSPTHAKVDTCMNDDLRIAIIGAGMSGILCGIKLEQAGLGN